MKNIFVATGMLSLAFSGGVQAYDGTINFVGKILDQTCSVTTGSKNMTVITCGFKSITGHYCQDCSINAVYY